MPLCRKGVLIMRERDETILFSAVAILLAALTLAGLTSRALADARAAARRVGPGDAPPRSERILV